MKKAVVAKFIALKLSGISVSHTLTFSNPAVCPQSVFMGFI
jgi:hypothetical protein